MKFGVSVKLTGNFGLDQETKLDPPPSPQKLPVRLPHASSLDNLDDSQITHLIRVRLKMLLYDSFWGGSLYCG